MSIKIAFILTVGALVIPSFGYNTGMMNLFRTIVVFLIFSVPAFGSDSTAVKQKRLAIGIIVSPDYCYRKLEVAVQNIATAPVAEKREDNEVPMWAYTAGARASYRLNRYFCISLGAAWSQKGYQSIHHTKYDPSGNPTGYVAFRYNYNYIDVPLKAHFCLGNENACFTMNAGITPSYMLEERTDYIDNSNGETKKYAGQPNYIYNPFNCFLSAGIGLDLKIGKKMGILVEPTYNYGIRRTKNADITEYLWNYSLSAGCYFRL